MDQGDTETDDTETLQLSIDEWQDVGIGVFWDIAEQHGLGGAVTVFLTTLGITAVETDTVGQCIASMQGAVEIMLENAPRGGARLH
jgi:hypothetical protein